MGEKAGGSAPEQWPASLDAMTAAPDHHQLARPFHVRTYYVAAFAGTIISLAAFTGLARPHAVAFLGGGMAAVMRLAAAYVILNADRITSRAMREPWAVCPRSFHERDHDAGRVLGPPASLHRLRCFAVVHLATKWGRLDWTGYVVIEAPLIALGALFLIAWRNRAVLRPGAR